MFSSYLILLGEENKTTVYTYCNIIDKKQVIKLFCKLCFRTIINVVYACVVTEHFCSQFVGIKVVVILIGVRTFTNNTSTAGEWMNVLNTNLDISRDSL